MKAVVALEHRFVFYKGCHYSTVYTHESTWARYLKRFGQVYVLARVHHVDELPEGLSNAEGPGVEFLHLPAFVGPVQFFKARRKVMRLIKDAAKIGDAYILRVPGTIGNCLWKVIRKTGVPYGVEVVGNPQDVFKRGAIKSWGRIYFRYAFSSLLKKMCAQAAVAAYVTREELQRHFPPGGWSTHYSSVTLKDEAFVDEAGLEAREDRIAKKAAGNGQPWRIVSIGTMMVTYKRQDLLIRMMADLREQGLDATLTLIGDGTFRPEYEQLAADLGVQELVEFTGFVSAGEGVRRELDGADLFVQSSATEGLARVLMESSARGLPIIATHVGGSAEVVDADELVAPNDQSALTKAVADLLRSPDRMSGLVKKNHEKARDYHYDVLEQRRASFCDQLYNACKQA